MIRLKRKDSYVYIYFRPNGLPCYVGKGTRDRWSVHERKCLNPHFSNIIKSSSKPLPKVIIRNGLSNKDACALEIALIRAIGRKPDGPLVNMTDGGDGAMTGRNLTEEHKEKIRRAARRPENVAKMRKVGAAQRNNLGRKFSKEWRKKLSESHKGYKAPEAQKLAMSRAGIERWDDAKARKKHGIKMRRTLSNPAIRKKLSKSISGFYKKPENKHVARNRSLKRWSDPKERARMSKIMTKAFSTKAYRKAQSKRITLWWANRKRVKS